MKKSTTKKTKKITVQELERYVEEHIGAFHEHRLLKLQELNFKDVLTRKNPYLFKAKGIATIQDFVKTLLDAYLSAQEEGIFGNFLEGLAIFVCSNVYGGKKTAMVGIDLEFQHENTYYFVSIKSGPNWGNSDQMNRMKQNFQHATNALQRLHPEMTVLCVNGCCYGRDNKPQKDGYLKLCGQRFWEFISGNPDLYIEIIEPLGYRAKERNADFYNEYARTVNRFSLQFAQEYCIDGLIDWRKILAVNSAVENPLSVSATKRSKR
jgi:Type II restriction endonuclease EcoO109I